MAETIMDQLDEAAVDLPAVGHVELFCGPDVYHALRVEQAQDQTKGKRPSDRAEVNVVFTMDAKAWRLEHDGEPVADGRMEEQ